MRCLICGSRTIVDYELLKQAIKESGFNITEIVSGCASGADRLGERWAKENNLKLHQFPPDWQRYGSVAGYLRNKEMVQFVSPPSCDNGCIIALWDGVSRGTEHTIKLAIKAKVNIFIKSPSFPDEPLLVDEQIGK
jgi:hypothetical protein